MTAMPGESIGGWLIAPLAWLLVALLSASLLALLLYTTALMLRLMLSTLMSQSALNIATWFVSFVFRDRDVVLHALADYRLFQTPLKRGAKTLLSGCSSPCCWR